MKHYFTRFKLVEVQRTFYKPPELKAVMKWREEAPPDFEFTLKAWQVITHPPSSPTYRKAGLKVPPGEEKDYSFFKPTDKVREAWGRTRDIAKGLKARIVLFQCPARFGETEENIKNLRRFFQAISRDFLFVWEPRGDWREETIKALCQDLDLIHCVDPFERAPLYGERKYFRLHGGPGYRHSYSEKELERLKEIEGKEIYFLFNNITMYEDALRFIRILGGE